MGTVSKHECLEAIRSRYCRAPEIRKFVTVLNYRIVPGFRGATGDHRCGAGSAEFTMRCFKLW